MNKTPELKARDHIDKLLELAGWVVAEMKSLNWSAGPGIAIRDTKPLQFDDIEIGKFDAIIETTRINSRKGADYGTLIR